MTDSVGKETRQVMKETSLCHFNPIFRVPLFLSLAVSPLLNRQADLEALCLSYHDFGTGNGKNSYKDHEPGKRTRRDRNPKLFLVRVKLYIEYKK